MKQVHVDRTIQASGAAFRRTRLLAALLALLAAPALPNCTGRDSALDPNPGQPSATSTSSTPLEPDPDSVAFTSDTLNVAPGKSVRVRVLVSPPGEHTVRVAVFGAGSNAFIDASELQTDSLGRAEFTLSVTASSAPFSLRAFAGSKSAELVVNVSDLAVGDLLVVPSYVGSRAITEWNVRVVANGDCSDAALFGGPDRILFAPDEPMLIEDVPTQSPVAVFVSSREYAFGCAVRALEPGKRNAVPVAVEDLPLRIDNIRFPVYFWTTTTSVLTTHLDAVVATMVSAFRRNGATDAATLLQQMAELYPSTEDFLSASVRGNWEAALSAALSPAGAEGGLTSRLTAWLRTAATRLSASFEAGDAPVVAGDLVAADAAGKAFFRLESFAGLDPSTSQMPSEYGVTVSAEGDDVRAAFKLYLIPSVLLSELAEEAARTGERTGVIDALEHSLSDSEGPLLCARVAEVIRAANTSGPGDAGTASEGLDCDTDCFDDLCHRALVSRWVATQTSVARAAVMDFVALGPGEIDDEARVQGFAGHWRGETDFLGTGPVQLEGSFDTEK